MRSAVFFDRDGVLNNAEIRMGKPYPPVDANALVIDSNALDGLTQLKHLGFLLICVTNQPDIARGTRTLANVQQMNEKVCQALPLDELSMCIHDTKDNCLCRKPKPGLLLDAASRWDISLAESWMIGDRTNDIKAGLAAGCKTIFIDRSYSESTPETLDLHPDFTCQTLAEAVAYIIFHTSNKKRLKKDIK